MITLVNLCGSIALLLWGIRMVRTAVTRGFGGDLRNLIRASSGRRVAAFLSGIGVTILLQSSTATSMLVASFSSQPGMTAASAFAVLLGADVGTTIVVQLFSHRVAWMAPLLILIGVVRFMTSERSRPRNLGRAAIGLGLIMLSLQLIGTTASDITGAGVVKTVLVQLGREPLLMILMLAIVTIALHSSVAAVLLVAALAESSAVPVQSAVLMVLGANLGGAVLLALSAHPLGRAARVAPAANVCVRLAGVLIFMFAPAAVADALAVSRLGPAGQVVLFHSFFNVVIALMALPFASTIADSIERLLPAAAPDETFRPPSNLEEQGLETPVVALACATREALRIGDVIKEMLNGSMDVIRSDDTARRKHIEGLDDEVDRLYEAIKLYLVRLTREELDKEESERAIEILGFTTNLEHVGDIVDKNLMELAAKKAKAKVAFSNEGLSEIEALHKDTVASLDLALNVFVSGDLRLARRLLAQKVVVRDRERGSAEKHFARISKGRPESLDSSALHLDILRDLKRINSHFCAVAYPILERASELAESRLLAARSADSPRRPPSSSAGA